MYFRPEGIDDDRHQRRGRGDYRREEINKARRFIRDDVFFENELEQIGERLQKPAGSNAVWPQPALDKPEHASLCQHRVRHHRHHDREGDEDADQQKNKMF